MMKKLIEMFAVILLLAIAFFANGIICCQLKNYSWAIILMFTLFTAFVLFIVTKFNKDINGVDLKTYVGSANHLKATFIGLIVAGLIFIIPVGIFSHYNYTAPTSNMILNKSVGLLFIGVYEELIFRGFLLVGLLAITKKLWLSVLASTLVFTLLHTTAYDSLNYFAGIFTAGMVLCCLYVAFNSILAPIMFHIAINITNNLLLLPPHQDSVIVLFQTILSILVCTVLFLVYKDNFNNPFGLKPSNI